MQIKSEKRQRQGHRISKRSFLKRSVILEVIELV